MTDELYKPVVPNWVSPFLFRDKNKIIPIHEDKAFADWKFSYSRKYKYAMKNGWLIEHTDGSISEPKQTHIILKKKEIDRAVKRTQQTINNGSIKLGKLSFHRFIQRTGLSDQKINTPIDYINTVTTKQQVRIFKKIGFNLINQTLDKNTLLKNAVVPKTSIILQVHYRTNQSLYFLLEPRH